MGTHTALYVQTIDRLTVQKTLAAWLERVHNRPARIEPSDSTFEVYKAFVLPGRNEEEFSVIPSLLAIGSGPPDWLVIHHNSFYEMLEMGTVLSGRFQCWAVSVLAQTVTEAWCINVFREGKHIRKLYSADYQWLADSGLSLPFEKKPLGENIGTLQNPLWAFGSKHVKEYCAHLGLKIWDDFDATDWITIRVVPESKFRSSNVGSN